MNNGAHYQYKKRQVEGGDQGALIIMLYDGAIKFLMLAKEAIDNNDVEASHNYIVRAQAVINELISSLKVDVGEIVVNLLRLYEFMNRQLADANASKNKRKIDGVLKLLSSLREGWVAIINKLKNENKAGSGSIDAKSEDGIKKDPINVAV